MNANAPKKPQRKVTAKAKEWSVTKSPEKGTHYVQVLFQASDDRSYVWKGFLTEATAERTFQSLRYMGWRDQNLTRLDGLDRNRVELVLEEEEYNEKTYWKVAWVNRSPLAEAILGDELASIAEKWKLVAGSVDEAGEVHDGEEVSF